MRKTTLSSKAIYTRKGAKGLFNILLKGRE
jgi:hypothetical protein